MVHNTKTLRILASLVGIFLLCGLPFVNAQTPQQIAKSAFLSTVLLVMEDSNGQPLSLGSGFFVGADQVATNLPVIEEAARGYAKIVGKETKFNIEGITAVDANRDLVILKVVAFGTQAVTLGNSDLVQVGETVYAVGNPRGLEGTFSQGIISSVRAVGTDKLIQITAPLSPGSSGGPVLNSRGNVIGVSVLTIRDGQNLNFAIPSNYLRTLRAKTGVVRPLSQAKSAAGKRSILADFGGGNVEGITGGKFTWNVNELIFKGYLNYTFSLRNRLRENVRNVHYIVIFYDSLGDPIDATFGRYSGTIPAGLAKRIKEVASDNSVKEMSTRQNPRSLRIMETWVKFRVLDYEIVR